MYKIVRKFYRDAKAMEAGAPYKIYEHELTPMTLVEAETVKAKMTPPKNVIDHIAPIESEPTQ